MLGGHSWKGKKVARKKLQGHKRGWHLLGHAGHSVLLHHKFKADSPRDESAQIDRSQVLKSLECPRKG